MSCRGGRNPDLPLDTEALMTYAATVIPAPGCWPIATKHASRRGHFRASDKLEATPLSSRRVRAIPGLRHANFLEFPPTAFHYSVIGSKGAVRRAAKRTFNSVRALSNSVKAVPLRMHKEMIDGHSTKPRQFRFRTGDRKINANGFESGRRNNARNHVPAGLLMRLAENIHATLPSYATIAPILHVQHVTPAQRGITFSTGAADATGR